MKNSLTTMNIIHFADDSTLHVKYRKGSIISPVVNNELCSINSWLRANKLCLNVDKTKYMIFSIKDKPPDLNISIGHTTIGRTEVHKFLGVHIDEKLTFGSHISKICSKISRGIGMLRRMKSMVPKDVLKQLYYAFIYSHFTYAITSYQSAYLNQTQKLINLVNRALKLVFDVNIITPTLLKNKSVMDFEIAAEYFSCINIYRILKTDSHIFFRNRILSFQNEHEHATRATSLEILNLPFYRLSKCKKSFIPKGLYFWNKLPLNIKNNPRNCKSFKRALKTYLFERIL